MTSTINPSLKFSDPHKLLCDIRNFNIILIWICLWFYHMCRYLDDCLHRYSWFPLLPLCVDEPETSLYRTVTVTTTKPTNREAETRITSQICSVLEHVYSPCYFLFPTTWLLKRRQLTVRRVILNFNLIDAVTYKC